MRPALALALALALCAPAAWAQAPAPQEPKPAAKQPAKPRSAPQAPKAHGKPTPEQIRRFNELQKQQGRKY